ncbi:MAG: hydroxyethylthiazole kinase [Candidatus Methanomethylophilaceae archaeon]|nr:hydroxyethylthiazole kinase [Candidatus Methanomethylophilaceae archaeon]
MEFRPSEYFINVRQTRPLVHHITNYVTVNDCANITLCAGGSPIMTDEGRDVRDIASVAGSVVLNIGTLNERTVDSMHLAGTVAHSAGVPVVLDPVGYGATSYRTSVTHDIIERVHPDVIKGNGGEMGMLVGAGGEVEGVDSHMEADDLVDHMTSYASRYGGIIASSGRSDYISDGRVTLELGNGVDMLSSVSGTGCMLSSVIGAFVGANGASVLSVATAFTAFNIAAEDAIHVSDGPGSFKVALMDSLYRLEPSELDSRVRWCEI